MPNPSCLLDLKNTLPRNAWPQVIPALRHDPLVWNALQNPDFRRLAVSRLGSHPKRWTPARLALLTVERNLTLEELRVRSLNEIDPELRVQVIRTYELHAGDSPPKITLPAAGQLMLALLERHRRTASWESIPHAEHWKTVFACLFGCLEQPMPLLLRLPFPLAGHALLANPLPLEEQARRFTAVLVSLPHRERLNALREIALQRPQLARKLSASSQPSSTRHPSPVLSAPLRAHILGRFQNLRARLTDLDTALRQAEAHLISGFDGQALDSWAACWQTAQSLQTETLLQTAQISAALGQALPAEVDALPAEHAAALALSLLQSGDTDTARGLLAPFEEHPRPLPQLARACLAHQSGDTESARQAALSAHARAAALSPYYTRRLAAVLLTLKQPTPAVDLLERLRRDAPNDPDLAHLTAQAHAALGAYPQAIHAIHLATALDPNNLDYWRDYAKIHAYFGQWLAALETWEQIVAAQHAPPPEDLRQLAACALQSEQPQRAAQAAQAVLARTPQDGLAQALLGEALWQTGEQQAAHEYLQQGVQNAPDQALPWLALARVQRQDGDLPAVETTLRKAASAAPDQPEIQLALGENYLQNGAVSQALACLRHADQLAAERPALESAYLRSRITLPLARALFELGHATEALEAAQSAPPLAEQQTAHLHLRAQVLLFLGRPQEAIPLLAKALLAAPGDIAVGLDYARAQLDAGDDPHKAIYTLRALLAHNPECPEALALLAEALHAHGEPQEALKIYRRALATRLGEDANWQLRLSLGFARTALALHQPEAALAALQQAKESAPHNPEVLRTLAEAYAAAELPEQACQTAQLALDAVSDDRDTLVWFADLVFGLQDYEAAAGALTRALQTAPDDTGALLRLGAVHRQAGDFKSARAALRRVAALEEASYLELRTAARRLHELDAPEDAARCLRAAVQRCAQSAGKASTLEADCEALLDELLEVYQQLGMPAEALAALDEFNAHFPQNRMRLGQRVLLLHQLGRGGEALTLLQGALREHPDDFALQHSAAQLHYALGDLPRALAHARKAVDALPAADEMPSVSALSLAADLAAAALQPELAREFLASLPLSQPAEVSTLCLRAELALESGAEVDAADALTAALALDSHHPRALALQARLTARYGGGEAAHKTLQNALSAWGAHSAARQVSPAGHLALAEAALELHQWSAALYLLQEAVSCCPQEPRVHLRLARGLVLRAEYQQLCDDLKALRHAPGESALGEFAYRSFNEAILAATQSSSEIASRDAQMEITRWRLRGRAVFQPSVEHAQALNEVPQTADGRAALLAALRRSNAPSVISLAMASAHLAKEGAADLFLWAQIALALETRHPQKAGSAAQKTCALASQMHHPALPLFYALRARVAEQGGWQALAAQSLEEALARWPDEAAWQAWVAEIQRRLPKPDYDAAIQHLQNAVKLAPKNSVYLRLLGLAYLETGNTSSALSALEQAARLSPEDAATCLALARAYRQSGEYAQTFRHAVHAARLHPENAAAHLFLAETAFEIGNLERALGYCQTVLALEPQNVDALLLQARSLAKTGQHEKALQPFEQALERQPQSVPLWLEYVALLRQARGADAALHLLHHLAEEHPDNARVLAALAEAMLEREASAPAMEVAKRALHAKIGSLDCSQEAHLLQVLGRSMRRNGQLDQAIQYFNRALQCNPEHAAPYVELGRVYQERRQHDRALDAFHQAIALAPGDPQAYYHAGQSFKAIRDYASAEDMLKHAARLAPDDLRIHRLLGSLVALNLVHSAALEQVNS